MQTIILAFITLSGFSLSFWGIIGSLRFIHERTGQCGGRAMTSIATRRAWGFGGGAVCGLFGVFLFYLLFEVVRISLASSGQAETVQANPLLFLGAITALWALVGAGSAWLARRLVLGPRIALTGTVGHSLVYWAGLAGLLVPTALETDVAMDLVAGTSAGGLLVTAGLSWLGVFAGTRGLAKEEPKSTERLEPKDVAVIIPAHNEEKSIGACLDALAQVLPVSQVFVGSDGSSDRTVEIARQAGCIVEDIQPNRGKAQAIQHVLDQHDIIRRFGAVLILDADSEIDKHYLARALPLFDDPRVAAVAGHVISKWRRHFLPSWSMLFVAYRVRLYTLLQALLRFGQTWKRTNVSFIIPGFASMYRTEVLSKIDITAPGLIIEDFNMTFELQKKKLGLIAYTPLVCCQSQDPRSLTDYVKQIRRWNLGFWQTVRRHGIWASSFWASLGLFTLEMFIFSVFIVAIPVLLAVMLFGGETAPPLLSVAVGPFRITLLDIAVGLFLADYLITVAIAAIERKWLLLIYGLAFVFIRWVDGLMFLYTFVLSWFVKSDGRWLSPSRT